METALFKRSDQFFEKWLLAFLIMHFPHKCINFVKYYVCYKNVLSEYLSIGDDKSLHFTIKHKQFNQYIQDYTGFSLNHS